MMKSISGTVKWIELSGGFWGIEGDDGNKYYPESGLPPDARHDGCRIRANCKPSGGMNIIMWGLPVKLTDVTLH